MRHLLRAIIITGVLAGCTTTEKTADEAQPADGTKPAVAAPAKSGSVFSKVGLCDSGGGGALKGQSLSSSSGIGGRKAAGLGGCAETPKSQAKKLKMDNATKPYSDDRQEPFLERANVDPGGSRTENGDDDPFPVTPPPAEE